MRLTDLDAAAVPTRADAAIRGRLAYLIGRCIWPAGDNGVTPTSAPEDAANAVLEELDRLGYRPDNGVQRAIVALQEADTSDWPGGRNSEVEGCREAAIAVLRGIS